MNFLYIYIYTDLPLRTLLFIISFLRVLSSEAIILLN